MALSVAWSVGLTLATLALTAAVRRMLQACRGDDGTAPDRLRPRPATLPAPAPVALTPADLDAVARDEDLDAVIAQLQKVHDEVNAIEARMRKDLANGGRDYDAWAARMQLSTQEERLTTSKLGALLRLREDRRAARAVTTSKLGARAHASAATQRPLQPPAAADVHARAAADLRAFNASSYTARWRAYRTSRQVTRGSATEEL